MIIAEITKSSVMDWRILKTHHTSNPDEKNECTAIRIGDIFITVIKGLEGELELRFENAKIKDVGAETSTVELHFDDCD